MTTDALTVGMVCGLLCPSLVLHSGWGQLALYVAATICALYATDQYSLEPKSDWAIAGAGFAGIAALCLSIGALGNPGATQWWASFLVAAVAAPSLVGERRLLSRILGSPAASRQFLLLGDAGEMASAVEELRRYSLAGIMPLAVVDPTKAPMDRVGCYRADGLVPGLTALNLPDWHEKRPLEEEAIDLPALFGLLSGRIPVRQVDERWWISQLHWQRGMVYQLAKRALDVGLSLVGLAIGVAILPLVAALIWLEDRGPIFYSQARIGLNGRIFRIFKLRTMVQGAEQQGALQAQVGDRRVTRAGSFLRKSRLDEVPQLLNVLKGEMSLVGPRPERPEFVLQYLQSIPSYERRHLVLPGITGWAQVRYPYGACLEDAEEKLQYDLFYLKHRSFLFDLQILLRTVSVVLNRTGSR